MAMKESGVAGTASMYAALASALADRGLNKRAAEVVGEMLNAGYQPSPYVLARAPSLLVYHACLCTVLACAPCLLAHRACSRAPCLLV